MKNIEIRLAEKLTQKEIEHLFHWRERVFPVEGKDFSWAKPKWHLLGFSDGNLPVAHLGYADFDISCEDGSVKKVIGVGGVVVRPEAQGQHIPAQLFNYLHQSSHAKGLSNTFTLFCPSRLEGYYQKQGYVKYEGAFTFLQNQKLTATSKLMLMQQGSLISTNKINIDSEPW